MLDNKYTNAYNSIRAPKDMLDRILSADKPVKKSFNYARLTSIAACILLLALMVPLYAGLTQPSVTISEISTVNAQRSTDISIPILLELDRKTTVTVSKGSLNTIDTKELIGTHSLIWSFPCTEAEDLTLSLKDIFGTKVYKLCFNENNGSWTIVK